MGPNEVLALALAPPQRLQRLAPPEDRERIDSCLSAFFRESRRRYGTDPRLGALYDRIAAFTLNGGKRARPRLCLASHRVFSRSFDAAPPALLHAATSLELLHAFMLVHDDLIDGSALRRDQPCLHEAVRRDEGASDAKVGRDLGLIAGDLLFALGIRQLGQSGLKGAALRRALRLLSDMLLETGGGEALDVLADGRPLEAITARHVHEVYLRKTARYTVSGPLALGAIVAGAGPEARRALRRFGDQLGFGFQVRNDLEGLEPDVETGEHADLDSGKRTYPLWLTYRRLGPDGRIELDAALAASPGPARRRKLLGLMRESGALVESLRVVRDARDSALLALEGPGLDEERREDLALLAQWVLPSPARTSNGNGNGHHA